MHFLYVLQLIAAFNFLFLGVVILLSRKKVTYGVNLLGIFLLAKGITLFTNLAYIMNWSINVIIINILSSALFLYAPFLYFFARHLVNKTHVTLSKDCFHFIPFILYTCYNIIELISPFENSVSSNIIALAYYAQAISYTIISFRLIHKKGDHSKTQAWLKYLLLSFLVVWIMFLSEAIFATGGNYSLSEIFKGLGIVSLLILANLTLVMAISSPESFFKGLRIFKGSNSDNKLITEDNFKRMLSLMSDKSLFTNPNLKVIDISNELNLSERNTSLLIKTYHGGNFYDFLNSLRIEKAKRLFIEQQDALTITEVLYEVGFNSKSVFNTVFKKKVGMTPSQFKKHNSNISSVV